MRKAFVIGIATVTLMMCCCVFPATAQHGQLFPWLQNSQRWYPAEEVHQVVIVWNKVMDVVRLGEVIVQHTPLELILREGLLTLMDTYTHGWQSGLYRIAQFTIRTTSEEYKKYVESNVEADKTFINLIRQRQRIVSGDCSALSEMANFQAKKEELAKFVHREKSFFDKCFDWMMGTSKEDHKRIDLLYISREKWLERSKSCAPPLVQVEPHQRHILVLDFWIRFCVAFVILLGPCYVVSWAIHAVCGLVQSFIRERRAR